MKRCRLSILICTIVSLLLTANISGQGKSAKFTLDISEDATLPVLTHILQAKEKGISLFSFEKGTYHFYSEKALEEYRHISNHDDQLTRTAFPLKNMKDVIIDGNGSTFIFHGMMIPFMVDGSSNITIKNLSVDWATPFHSEAEVIANNASEKTYDIRISEAYPYEIRNGQLVFLKEHFEHSVGQMFMFDAKEKKPIHNNVSSTWYTVKQPVKQKNGNKISYKYSYSDDKYNPQYSGVGKEIASQFKEIKPGVVRVYNHPRALPPVGSIMVMKGAKGVNRVAPAFHVTGCRNFRAENVNVLHAGGMGFLAENSRNLTLDHFKVIPSEGRYVSATADGTHFVSCSGKIEFLNCTITNQLDDGTNIHGAHQEVVDVLDAYTLGIRLGHFQQYGLGVGEVGDTIGIIDDEKSIFPYAYLTVKGVQKLNGSYVLISFNEKLPENVKPGFLTEKQAYSEVLIENCNFSKNRAHGILIGSAKKAIIRNNYFHNEMGAMLFPAVSGHWYESNRPSNVLIENNHFKDCGYANGRGCVIELNSNSKDDRCSFSNFKLINNKFECFDNPIIHAKKVNGFEIKGNSFLRSDTYEAYNPNLPAFHFEHSKNVKFRKNKYTGKAKVIIECDESMQKVKFN